TNPREAKPGDTRALDARLEPADAQPPARQRIVKDPVLRSAARKVAGGGGSWRRRPVAFTGIAPARTRRAWPRRRPRRDAGIRPRRDPGPAGGRARGASARGDHA